MLQIRDILWGLLFTGCAAAIQVQITPAQGEISVGESKFFLCEVVGDAKDIDWFAPSGEKILPPRPNISVSRSDESTSILTIYHANVDNAGIYKCVAKNGDKEAQATVQVKIFQKITFQSAPSRQEFNEGDNADIVCDVVSSPPPTIIWKHKGSKLQSAKDVRYKIMDNGHLLIRGIKKADEGMYNCEARVMARGEIDFRMIKVIVNVLPTIRARKSEVNATADIGESALLACDADGYPEPTVTWTHNNVVLETGDKYSLNEDGSELVIKEVKKVDEGDYTCIAKNKAGEKSEEVSLNVFVLPNITYFNNQTASEFDEEVTLTCEASGDPTPTISWRFGKRVFTEGEQSLDRNVVVRSHARVSSLTLKNVQFTYAGRYLCTASNSIGEVTQEVFLEVRYAPKIMGVVAAYTWEGNPVNISCEVTSNPRASVIWFRDGTELPSGNSTNIKIFNTPTISHLEITPESQNDFGSYNCTATNVIGTESKEFLLIQAEVPSSPKIEEVQPFSSTAVVEFEEPNSLGGVPILKYRVEWRLPGKEWSSEEYKAEEDMTRITIVGLKPETTYEVKMSAINGKGEGESSRASTFKTEPVQGEPNAPILEVTPVKSSNSVKVKWTKQDDGGSPIKHYLVRYKAKHVSDWKPELRLPPASEYIMLNGLDWNTDYEIRVVAENQRGRSEPSITSFRTATEPTTIPDTAGSGSGLSTGAIVGILIVVFFLLLVGVDVTCYFLNKCGLLMCIAVNFCGKSGPGAKSKDMEEGKAAFSKDESKEPIVEVRTEEENIPNQEGGGPTEPNETTPLTEPDGKTVKDDNTKAEKEVKNAMAEVKTVPNEAPQANGNESKA
ncbi:neural cell adhesion molecule 1a isoform X14 [Girardinichthys multiradiatus]|uniref:neural cell adhesion molecule 1a isoform X14 n=1 Tax=Girardinichthys multiradiatus TaxID=208333 RepID=UPI001FAB4F4D|nr:neural cell adhesion molecule 1a isoform X14 [Girardinichthys multiradiatus]